VIFIESNKPACKEIQNTNIKISMNENQRGKVESIILGIG
jgi:hypothetical protein